MSPRQPPPPTVAGRAVHVPQRADGPRYVQTGFGVMRVPAVPDPLAYAVAGNIKDTTPGLRVNPLNAYAQDFIGWRLFRHAVLMKMWRGA